MFTEITWALYLRGFGALLFLYYTLLLLQLYLPKIRSAYPGTAMAGHTTNVSFSNTEEAIPARPNGHLVPSGGFESAGNDYDTIEELVDRVKAAHREGVANSATDGSVRSMLSAILSDYRLLGRSAFRPSN